MKFCLMLHKKLLIWKINLSKKIFGGESMAKKIIAIFWSIFVFSIISVANAETIDDYTEMIKNNPNDFMAYHSRGIAYAKQKNFQQAVLDFSEAIKLNPNESRLYYNRALAYYYLKNYSQAISDCNKAIQLNPNYGAAYTNRGNCYFKLQNFTSATSDYNKALELNPNDANANKNLKILKQKFSQNIAVSNQQKYIISEIRTPLNNPEKMKKIKNLIKNFKVIGEVHQNNFHLRKF